MDISAMAATMANVVLPAKAVVPQQRAAVQRPVAFGNTFMKGSSAPFAGQSLAVQAGSMAGPRKVTTMAAKGKALATLGPGRAIGTMCYAARVPETPTAPHCASSPTCHHIWVSPLSPATLFLLSQCPDTSSLRLPPVRPTLLPPSALLWVPRV